MLLDIGVGILLGILFDANSDQYGLPTFLLVAVFGALAPDMDYIYHLFSGGNSQNDHRHREILHNPLFLAAGWLLFAVFASPLLAGLFTLGVLAHFVHDSIGIGWGVQWLFPLKRNHYGFFYRVHTAVHKPKPPRRLLYIWPNDQLDALQEQYGDPEWFSNTYKRWHPYAVFEIVIFIIALVALLMYTS